MEVQAQRHAREAKAVQATNEAEAMKIVQDGNDWMLVNNDGIEVTRRSSREQGAPQPKRICDAARQRLAEKPSRSRQAQA